MPATPARIGFITQDLRLVSSGPDDAVVSKYGARARDTVDPIPTMFDSMADTQAVCNARHALLKADRRRFRQTIAGEATVLSLDYTTVMPTVTVIDEERAADMPALIGEMGVDFERGQSIVTTWG